MQNFCRLLCAVLMIRGVWWVSVKVVSWFRDLHACGGSCGQGRDSPSSSHTDMVAVQQEVTELHWQLYCMQITRKIQENVFGRLYTCPYWQIKISLCVHMCMYASLHNLQVISTWTCIESSTIYRWCTHVIFTVFHKLQVMSTCNVYNPS